MPYKFGIFKPHFTDRLKFKTIHWFPKDMYLLVMLFIVTFTQVSVSTLEEIWGLKRDQSHSFCGNAPGETLGSGRAGRGGG